ncbi:MAG: glycosyl hydrolase [Cyclobacteriaceae bacterium]|nr:glycosyl hydrolase [Cyclobacteriaceae bacterium]
MRIFAGTDKGLIEYSERKGKLSFEKVHFQGLAVGYFTIDQGTGHWWVALNHKHWGVKIHHSADEGATWEAMPVPAFGQNVVNLQGNKVTLTGIWVISHSLPDDPDTFYIGTEPAALFVTHDRGRHYELVQSLWEHPSRHLWTGGGKGSHDPFLHSIIIDNEDPKHLLVGISCAGVFHSHDAGITWQPINKGIHADYLPNPYAEVGQDPHCIRQSKKDPNILWQQNHCGIYLSKDKGVNWRDISNHADQPYYGFALATDEDDDEKAWVIPCVSDDRRYPPGNKLSVYHTNNGGQSWQRQEKGLPEAPVFDIVLRQALGKHNNHLVFGTNNGNLYHSDNDGESWNLLSFSLAPVRSIFIG